MTAPPGTGAPRRTRPLPGARPGRRSAALRDIRPDPGPDDRPGHRRGARIRQRLRQSAALLAFVGLWQVLTQQRVRFWVRFDQLPTAVQVWQAFGRRLATDEYWQDLADSLRRIGSGFLLAAVLGVAAGVLTARSRWAADLLGPVLEVVRPIPAIALVPVAIMLFPENEQGIVFITCTAAFFPVLVSTRHAVRAVPPLWEEAVRTMGGGRARVLRSVVLPGALPGIVGGLSVGIGVAWICVISAEMVSGQFGVGYRTWAAYTVLDYPGVFVGMATIGLLGWATSGAVELIGGRLTSWLPPARAAVRPPRPATAPATAPAASRTAPPAVPDPQEARV
ncbi:ABC transporter permease [Kitasatospora sp. A2-31]|uniref:ABC transporter permease n=1 Tax=Kitasatospora sp. A2-31 TaxID=2916414 RepID=UPI001EE9BE90|nr:ABC transporter permease [Kitasatospora sp. A2-31]MCG6498300.1 ABC transporter permease [Kitasatospora sp. A2-31]